MLNFSRQQYAHFQVSAERQFQASVLSYLLECHGQVEVTGAPGGASLAALPRETLERIVAASVERGRERGLTWASNLTAYVVLRILVAPNFDSAPPLERCLAVPGAADIRFDDLVQRYSDVDWETVRLDSESARFASPDA